MLLQNLRRLHGGKICIYGTCRFALCFFYEKSQQVAQIGCKIFICFLKYSSSEGCNPCDRMSPRLSHRMSPRMSAQNVPAKCTLECPHRMCPRMSLQNVPTECLLDYRHTMSQHNIAAECLSLAMET